MKCFNHHDREAVGCCKSCNKGLCPACLADLGKGMACRGRCEGDVQDLIAMTAVNVAVTAKVPGQMRANRLLYSIMCWFFIAFGALGVVLGVLYYPGSEVLLVAGGSILLLGLLSTLIVSRMPRFDALETGGPPNGLPRGAGPDE